LPSLPRILAGRDILRRINAVEQMMWSLSAFGGTGLGRTDVELAVHRHGIAVDDLSVKLRCQRERQRRLSAGGRPKDDHQQRLRSRQIAMLGTDVQRILQWISCQ